MLVIGLMKRVCEEQYLNVEVMQVVPEPFESVIEPLQHILLHSEVLHVWEVIKDRLGQLLQDVPSPFDVFQARPKTPEGVLVNIVDL